MALSIAESVGWRRSLADFVSFAVMAVRNCFIAERTRVVFARLIAARLRDCLARLITDGLRFFTFVAAPCAIQFSYYFRQALVLASYPTSGAPPDSFDSMEIH